MDMLVSLVRNICNLLHYNWDINLQSIFHVKNCCGESLAKGALDDAHTIQVFDVLPYKVPYWLIMIRVE